jgi:Ricin-type beta-trefoil lectin domain-like
LCIGAAGGTQSPAFLIQESCTGEHDRLWLKTNVGGAWTFRNYHSGLIITVPGGSATVGQRLEQYLDRGYRYQRWGIVPLALTLAHG